MEGKGPITQTDFETTPPLPFAFNRLSKWTTLWDKRHKKYIFQEYQALCILENWRACWVQICDKGFIHL